MSAENILSLRYKAATGKEWSELCDHFQAPEPIRTALKQAEKTCPEFLEFLIAAASNPGCCRPSYYELITSSSDEPAPTSIDFSKFLDTLVSERVGSNMRHFRFFGPLPYEAQKDAQMSLGAFLQKIFGETKSPQQAFDSFIQHTGIRFEAELNRNHPASIKP